MKHILTEIRSFPTTEGTMTLRYELLAETAAGLTQYGAAVTNEGTGEQVRVMELTSDQNLASEFFDKISRGLVTPVTMRDVAEDFVAEI